MSGSRRAFLGAGLLGMGSASSFAADSELALETKAVKFAPDTLFLTWQQDPTTTMTVQWIGKVGETSDTSIYYSPTSTALLPGWQMQKTEVRSYPHADWKVFRAELTGLNPGTRYSFQIGKQSGTYHFVTMPARANDTISFISGGDVGVNSHAVANNIQAARQDPMFVVIGGDLAYDDGKKADINLGFIRNYSKHCVAKDGRLIPMVVTIGNHEVNGGYNQKREKAPFFFALFDGLFRERTYATLDFGDYLSLVLLDTGHIAPIGGAQTAWLEQTLKERVDHPHVIVVNHVPAYPSYRAMNTPSGKPGTGSENREHWVPLFDKYRVPVVLEHHDHTFKRTRLLMDGMANEKGVLYLGDGSWGRLRSPRQPERMPILAATSEDYHLSLHRLEGKERFHLALAEDGRIMDAARSGQRSQS